MLSTGTSTGTGTTTGTRTGTRTNKYFKNNTKKVARAYAYDFTLLLFQRDTSTRGTYVVDKEIFN